MFVEFSVIEILLFNRKKKKKQEAEEDEGHGNSVKISITCITPVLQAILDFFQDIISFQHVFHLGVGRSQIEWKLKVKTQISVFPWANIGQNDHSNPYIESTTVLSDTVGVMENFPFRFDNVLFCLRTVFHFMCFLTVFRFTVYRFVPV